MRFFIISYLIAFFITYVILDAIGKAAPKWECETCTLYAATIRRGQAVKLDSTSVDCVQIPHGVDTMLKIKGATFVMINCKQP